MSAALSRRTVLRGSGVVAVGAVAGFLLARRSDAARGTGTAVAANGYGPEPASTASTLASVEDIPDGGGLVLEDQRVVLVRSGDDVRAFSATCTHQGCTVDGVADGVITCPCHGSTFDADTGEVVTGPATRALDPVAVEVTNGAVTLPGGG
jgi:Rieske Fe-S protein